MPRCQTELRRKIWKRVHNLFVCISQGQEWWSVSLAFDRLGPKVYHEVEEMKSDQNEIYEKCGREVINCRYQAVVVEPGWGKEVSCPRVEDRVEG